MVDDALAGSAQVMVVCNWKKNGKYSIVNQDYDSLPSNDESIITMPKVRTVKPENDLTESDISIKIEQKEKTKKASSVNRKEEPKRKSSFWRRITFRG